MKPRPHIVILNGVGSVGKTSTARALQEISASPLLYVSMDAFLDMLPKAIFGHPDGLIFETNEQQGLPSIAIRTGPALERAMLGMRHAIAAMAAQGNHLVVDEVMTRDGQAEAYRHLLSDFDVRLVGLFAPLEELEARERQRGDRAIGLARWQYDRVHRGVVYDLEIDTTMTSPMESARIIRDAFGL